MALVVLMLDVIHRSTRPRPRQDVGTFDHCCRHAVMRRFASWPKLVVINPLSNSICKALSFSLANAPTYITRDLLSLNGLNRQVAWSPSRRLGCICTNVTSRALRSASIMQTKTFSHFESVNRTPFAPLANQLSYRLRNSIVYNLYLLMLIRGPLLMHPSL